MTRTKAEKTAEAIRKSAHRILEEALSKLTPRLYYGPGETQKYEDTAQYIDRLRAERDSNAEVALALRAQREQCRVMLQMVIDWLAKPAETKTPDDEQGLIAAIITTQASTQDRSEYHDDAERHAREQLKQARLWRRDWSTSAQQYYANLAAEKERNA